VWAEPAAVASGAGVPLGDLVLLNFRGDLGGIGEDTPVTPRGAATWRGGVAALSSRTTKMTRASFASIPLVSSQNTSPNGLAPGPPGPARAASSRGSSRSPCARPMALTPAPAPAMPIAASRPASAHNAYPLDQVSGASDRVVAGQGGRQLCQ
jgi:hypothetical protein